MDLPKDIDSFLKGGGQTLSILKSGPASQAFTAQAILRRGRPVVLVVPGAKELGELRPLLDLFSGETGRPAWERSWAALPPYKPERPDATRWAERWPALHALSLGGKPRGVILTVDNLLAKWPTPRVLDNASLTLQKGEELSPDMLLEQAVLWGYRRAPIVTEPGEFAMRGDILDIFAPGYEVPVRLEFFGDTLEDMRLFDPVTQRSRRDLMAYTLLPLAPAVFSERLESEAAAKWNHLRSTGDLTEAARLALMASLENKDGYIWPGLYYDKPVTFDEWVAADAVFLLASASRLRPALEEAEWAWNEFLEAEKAENEFKWPRAQLLWPEEKARNVWIDRRQIVFEDLVIGTERSGVELPEKRYAAFSELFWKPESRRRPWAALVQALRDWGENRFQTILSFHSAPARKKFLQLAEQEGLFFHQEYAPEVRGLYALVSDLKTGRELDWNGLLILPEDVVRPESSETGAGTRRDKVFKGLTEYEDLQSGDLLVHRDYGLSRFGGLHRMKIGDVANDYLLLFYDGDDKLYLPVDRLSLVQRYKGPEGAQPSLDRLGGSLWNKTKERARKAIEKIAHDLVEMYAYRKVAKGYAYGPVGEMFREFEAGFGFEETPDQARAIDDVLEDMDKPQPMDRLVCGDVGFGKTEVAMRAAFRAVLEGRQVALLCPTTVLAEQHYQNFLRRMDEFPVQVAMLSRFVPRQKQKLVIEAAARGEVDILIGTHRLLSQDVTLPNLGLLILDEEQRFGVKHKERLKTLKQNVDALTLTATPIPRTLQLSLSGIRSLSVIETPPAERKAVETALIERDDGMLRQILARELERGGQVFWVHNRVKGIEEVEAYVRKLAPGARIGRAHGQMPEKELEETMHLFWHGELDILVCTAIIESGLDFPKANTLIVDGAHMFGLGQLYQIRGRVGRSERQAYAYFMVDNLKSLSRLSMKRLQIILDMDYLGAGFQVAMEDLRLRGAGNILGEAQSGQIARVGLDLFLEMLEEEVRKQKGEPTRHVTEPELNFVFEAHLPETYIPDSRERLRYYKALSSAATPSALADLEGEIKDRFGAPPSELLNFLAVLGIKRFLGRLQVTKAELFPGRAVLTWVDGSLVVSPEAILAWLRERGSWARLLPPGKLELRWDQPSVRQGLEFIEEELSVLLPDRPGKDGGQA